MKTRFMPLLALLAIATLISCSKDKDNAKKEETIPKDNYTFLKSERLALQAKNQRSTEYSDAFEITNVERSGDMLNITVSFLKTCENTKGEFSVIWDGVIFFSHPPSITLWVKREAGDCVPTNTTVTEVLSVNLKELIKNQSLTDEGKIVIANSSKTNTSGDVTSTVSN